MPLVRAQRIVLSGLITLGQQTVVGALNFDGPTVIELDPSVYNKAGTYALFSYGSFDAADLANVEIDATDVTTQYGFTVTSGPTNVPSSKLITITLG
jgi:hypothetical protein